MGFETDGLIPETVHAAVADVHKDLVLLGRSTPTLWDAFVHAYTRSAMESPANPILTYKFNAGEVSSRILMFNHVHHRVFGLTIRCPYRCSEGYTLHTSLRPPGKIYKLSCNFCKRVSYVTRPEWVKPAQVRGWYYAAYPLQQPEWPTEGDLLPPPKAADTL